MSVVTLKCDITKEKFDTGPWYVDSTFGQIIISRQAYHDLGTLEEKSKYERVNQPWIDGNT